MDHLSSQKNSDKSRILEALRYLSLGWPVLPLHHPLSNGSCSCAKPDCSSKAKHPRTKNGVRDASLDPLTVCQWWTQWPEANIGLATGSISQLVVIDIDPRHGGDQSWQKWTMQNNIPRTLTTRTGGGGLHLLFKAAGKKIPNRTGVLSGIDIRGEGGYIVAPPSQHASGKSYEWVGTVDPLVILDLPRAVEDLILQEAKVLPIKGNHIPSGSRNSILASLAGTLRRQGLEEQGIREALHAINQTLCLPPLTRAEVATIAKSIGRYEIPDSQSTIEWVKPTDLPSPQYAVPEMTEDYLPQALRPWIKDIADRMQVPLELIAAPLIVSVSSVIGRQIGIYPKQKDDWLVVPNLWGAVIARPGFFKSPAIAEAMKPIEFLVRKSRQQFESEQIMARVKEEALKAKLEGLKELVKKSTRKENAHDISELKNDLQSSLNCLDENSIFERRYKTNDATVEKMACLLKENPHGIFLLRDELYGWLQTMNKSGREGDREFYLEAWNGYGSFTVDRIMRGTIHVPALCLSVFGGLQPGKLEAYVSQMISGGKGDDGFLQRLQVLVYPEMPKKWKNIDRKPNNEAYKHVEELIEKLARISPHELGCESIHAIPGLRFDEPAQDLFNKWREDLERRLRSDEAGSPAFESHLAKYRSLLPSLALIFHLISVGAIIPTLGHQGVKKVGIDSLKLAINWVSLLEAHARKVYAPALHPEIQAAQALLSKIKKGFVRDRDRLRSIYRRNWALLDGAEKVESAISVLEEKGWVKVETLKVATSSTERIRLHPDLINELDI